MECETRSYADMGELMNAVMDRVLADGWGPDVILCTGCGRAYVPASGTQKRCPGCHERLMDGRSGSGHPCPSCLEPMMPEDTETSECIVRTWRCARCGPGDGGR